MEAHTRLRACAAARQRNNGKQDLTIRLEPAIGLPLEERSSKPSLRLPEESGSSDTMRAQRSTPGHSPPEDTAQPQTTGRTPLCASTITGRGTEHKRKPTLEAAFVCRNKHQEMTTGQPETAEPAWPRDNGGAGRTARGGRGL